MVCTQCGFEFKYPCGCPYAAYKSSCHHDFTESSEGRLIMFFGPILFYLAMPIMAALCIPLSFYVGSFVLVEDELEFEQPIDYLFGFLAIYCSFTVGLAVNCIVLPFIYLVGPFYLVYCFYELLADTFEPQTENINRAKTRLNNMLGISEPTNERIPNNTGV